MRHNGISELPYSTGAWTPALSFSTPGDLSITYSVQIGSYIKTGSLVWVRFNLTTSGFTHTTASGSAFISGLPFTSRNISGAFTLGSLSWAGITKANYTHVSPRIAANASTMQLVVSGSGQGIAAIATGDMPTGGSVVLNGAVLYEAA